MWKVVNEDGGTARKARLKKNILAGKTGTAQFWRGHLKDNHTWFLCFAPYDKPKYALCILVEGAKSGGGVAAPLTAKIMEEIFAMDEGKEIKLTALTPAVGNFQHITSIDFNSATPSTYGVDVDQGDAPVESSSSDTTAKENHVTPDISDDSDAQGRVKNKPQEHEGLQKLFNFLGGGRSAVPKNSR